MTYNKMHWFLIFIQKNIYKIVESKRISLADSHLYMIHIHEVLYKILTTHASSVFSKYDI